MLMRIAQRGIDEGLSRGREDREESEMVRHQGGNARANPQVGDAETRNAREVDGVDLG